MKKYLCALLAFVIIFSLTVPAFAIEDDTRQTELSFQLDVPEPGFFVTIPDSLELKIGDTDLDITVEGTVDLGHKTIFITIEETQIDSPEPEVHLNLWDANADNPFDYLINYYILDANGDLVDQRAETHHSSVSVVIKGTPVAKFQDFFTQSISFRIDESQTPYIIPDTQYTGYIVFGILVTAIL